MKAEDVIRHSSDEPAFPVNAEQSPSGISPASGMTLRDYFAARAMPELMADASRAGFPPSGKAMTNIAARAYAAADEMLKAREA